MKCTLHWRYRCPTSTIIEFRWYAAYFANSNRVCKGPSKLWLRFWQIATTRIMAVASTVFHQYILPCWPHLWVWVATHCARCYQIPFLSACLNRGVVSGHHKVQTIYEVVQSPVGQKLRYWMSALSPPCRRRSCCFNTLLSAHRG